MSITLWQYYQDIAKRMADNALGDLTTSQAWEAQAPTLKAQFMRSMGLDPMPEKCDLRTEYHGEFTGEGYVARKISFNLLPELRGTGVAYYPDPGTEEKAPAVLFCCGHSDIGVLGYHDHAIMWAKRGYICFIFDTIEQHDNFGEHHGLCYGLHHEWISMGYPGSGGELWNTIRALDLLVSLPGVDPERIGATGNSGGGSLSFLIAVADERIKAVASSCGVTTHDYTIAHRNLMGHCDCIYSHNPYQRDTSEFVALIAPRPALFCYGIHDSLYNVAEYTAMVERAKRVYDLLDEGEKLRLFDYPGPHGYQPESVQEINEWFDKYVAGRPHPRMERGEKHLTEAVMSMFNGAPPHPRNMYLLPEFLSHTGSLELPANADEWPALRAKAIQKLKDEVFHAILKPVPYDKPKLIGDWRAGHENPNNRNLAYRAEIEGMETWITMHNRADKTNTVVISVADTDRTAIKTLSEIASFDDDNTLVTIEPRNTGFTYCPTQENYLLRAGALTGVTPVMAMIQDLQNLMPFILDHPFVKGKKVILYGRGESAVACLYHALLQDGVDGLVLEDLPATHRRGGYILGILRVLDIVQALGLFAPKPLALVKMKRIRNKTWFQRAYERLGASDKFTANNGNLQRALDFTIGKEA